VHFEHIAIRTMEPRDHNDLVPRSDSEESPREARIDFEPSVWRLSFAKTLSGGAAPVLRTGFATDSPDCRSLLRLPYSPRDDGTRLRRCYLDLSATTVASCR
jgi:hypothetical protein